MDDRQGDAPYRRRLQPPGPPPGPPPTRNDSRLVIVLVVVAVVIFLGGGVVGWAVGSNGHKSAPAAPTPSPWPDNADVSVYLCSKTASSAKCNGIDATPDQKRQIESELRRMPQIQWVHFLNRQQVYEQARKLFKNSPSIGELRYEDFPDAFRVKLKDPKQYRAVVAQIQNRPGVDQVVSRFAAPTP